MEAKTNNRNVNTNNNTNNNVNNNTNNIKVHVAIKRPKLPSSSGKIGAKPNWYARTMIVAVIAITVSLLIYYGKKTMDDKGKEGIKNQPVINSVNSNN